MQGKCRKEEAMEQEVSIQELMELVNDQQGEFIVHVSLEKEEGADAKEESF